MAAYIGHLSTTAGDGPEVVIKLAGLDVVVVTPDERHHVWPAHLVKITGVASPRFRIAFDDETAVFTAHHPSRFLFEFIPALQRVRTAAARTAGVADQSSRTRETTRSNGTRPTETPAKPARQVSQTAPDPVPASESPGTAGEPSQPIPQPAATDSRSSERRSPRRRTSGEEHAGGEPAVEKPLGAHWVSAEQADRSGLLQSTASMRIHQPPAPTEPPTGPQVEPIEERQPRTAYRPRRRLFRRDRPCEHEWEPRVIGGYQGRICVECFEVSLTRDPADSRDAPAEHIVVDLTDDALKASAEIEAMPDDGQTRPLLERLAGRYRDARRIDETPPPT